MSPLMLIVIGLALCFAGGASVRLAVLAAGFGAGWIVADVFDATALTALLIALLVSLLALIAVLLVAKSAFFVAGLVLGSAIAAKVAVIVAGVADDWLLTVILVPVVALCSGWLTARWERPVLRWGTAAAGAALILSGIGRGAQGADVLAHLWRPESTVGALLLASSWIVITVFGQRFQSRGMRRAALTADDHTD